MKITLKNIVLLFILFSLEINLAFPGTTGKISGSVIDMENNTGLPGVNVIIQETTLGAATNNEGYYVILNVPPGFYRLKASMIGYTSVTITEVGVSVDQTTAVNFTMKPEVISGEEVVIVADRPILRKDATATTRYVDDKELEAMPVNSFFQVVSLSAGVSSDFRGTHIRGGRVNETIYEVDGLPVQEVQMGYAGATVSNAAISEVSISTSGFNAEYGNAQSGVVNIVTKEGREKFEGKIESQIEIPEGAKQFQTGYQRYLFGFGGAIPFYNKLTYYLSGETVTADDGYPGIKRVDQPIQIYMFNTKLNYNITPNIKLSLGLLYNLNKLTRWVIDYKLRPGTFPEGETTTRQYSMKFTQLLSQKTYYELSFGYYYNHTNEHQPGKWWDIRQSEDWNTIDPTDTSDTWGTSYAINNISIRPQYLETNSDYTGFFDRLTTNYTGRGNFTTVLGKHHTLKTGFETTIYDLSFFTVWGILGAPYTFLYGDKQPVIENGKIIRKKMPDWLGLEPVRPKQYGIYLQDKMEFEGMIMNIGLRLDAFDPAAARPEDLWYAFYPADDTLVYPHGLEGAEGPWTYGGENFDIPVLKNLTRSSIKYHFSPRLGVSHPITERDVLHFSYGHFFQIPPFYYLYYNQNYSYDWWMIVGNPDLDAEKTIAYEVGVAHAFTNDLAINFTAFYKDINDLSNIRNFADPADPNRPYDDPETPDDNLVDTPVGIQSYINEDWGNIKGFEFSVRKRPSTTSRLSGTISYTYMIAKGRSSDPREGLLRRSNQTLAPTRYYPLDWDMRHKFVANIDYRVPSNFGINILIDYGSGLPYTGPQTSIQWEYNTRRLPATFRIDMKLNKSLKLWQGNFLNLYVQITNLLNRKNLVRFNDESTYVPIIQYLEEHPGEWGGPLKNPLVYGSHREIRGGLEIYF